MFKKLLVPLDRSALAEQAIGRAAAIARACGAGIDLVLVHPAALFDEFDDVPWNDQQWMDERKYLDAVAGELAASTSVPVTHAAPKGDAVDRICRRAWEIDADLIVMTSHGRTGLSRAWFGSVTNGVLRRAAIPVLVLRPIEGGTRHSAAHGLFKHLLVPFDGSTLAAEILAPVMAFAKCDDVRVTFLRIVQPIPLATYDAAMPLAYPPFVQDEASTNRLATRATEQLSSIARQLADVGVGSAGAEVVVAGHVAQSILEFARTHDVDAIAMSTHGRGASRFLMGSVADKVLRASDLPVLLYRPFVMRDADWPLDAAAEEELPLLARV